MSKLRIFVSIFVLLNNSIRALSINAHPKNMMTEVNSMYGICPHESENALLSTILFHNSFLIRLLSWSKYIPKVRYPIRDRLYIRPVSLIFNLEAHNNNNVLNI